MEDHRSVQGLEFVCCVACAKCCKCMGGGIAVLLSVGDYVKVFDCGRVNVCARIVIVGAGL